MSYITRTAITTLAIMAATAAQAQEKLNIEHATVFLSGAELTSTARLSLQKGENEIKFSNVAGDVNNQSIIVNATNGVLVESVTFQNNYLATDNESPKARALKDSLEQVKNQKDAVDSKIATLTEELAILQSNRKVSGDNTGLQVAELQKMLDLVNSRMERYLNDKKKEESTLVKINEHINRLTEQLQEEQQRDYQPGGMLVVKFYTGEATSTNVAISYVVPHAGWSPAYDVVASDAHSPIRFYYKANIYQNSGVKWNNVRLTLSTGNPQEGMQPPVLNPWYLSFYQPPPAYPYAASNNLMSNAPGIYQSKRGAASNTDGGRADANRYIIDGVQAGNQNTTMNSYVQVDNSGVNTAFDIELPYTIPTDGQQHLVAVKKYEVPATYEYFAVPKMDKDAFLRAQITNWEDLNLLAGPTNIFYEGTYIGQGNIDPRNVHDTLYLSMGRDKKIVIRKERDKNLRSVKTIGSNIRETFAYNIVVRNTRKEPVTILLQDQQPVSNDKDIELEDKNTGGADYDETSGLMKWQLTLAPNETKKLTFGYTVKYPKGKTVLNLK